MLISGPYRDRSGTAFLFGQLAFSEGHKRDWVKDRRLMRFILDDCDGAAGALWHLPTAWEAGWFIARRLQRQLEKERRRDLKRTAKMRQR